jgi:threonylcarbamoyladenosine tRNA methylthiotransferase MtaB
MKFYLTALGCKLNQAETEALARQVEAAGHLVTTDPTQADWAVINTCTVTHVAARKSRRLIRALRRANPALRLAVTGCYAEMSSEEVRQLQGVALVVANAHKAESIARILGACSEASVAPQVMLSARPSGGHTRAFVKIQDGCDNQCAYCIVTLARGPSRSLVPEAILAEAQARAAEGYREIVLTGVNIGAYGRDRGPNAPLPPAAGWSLARLAQEVLDATQVARLRLSSIEPQDLDTAMFDLWRDPRVCRHLHLPLQSGSSATLRRMGRLYQADDVAALMAAARARIPEFALTTDVIVGFPGETQAEFEESYAFVEEAQFARLHVFKYSPRPGTRAAEMAAAVAPEIAHARSERLIALGQRLATAFHRRYVGREVEVLLESSTLEGRTRWWDGLTDNYVRVRLAAEQDLANTLVCARCLAADAEGVRAELVACL